MLLSMPLTAVLKLSCSAFVQKTTLILGKSHKNCCQQSYYFWLKYALNSTGVAYNTPKPPGWFRGGVPGNRSKKKGEGWKRKGREGKRSRIREGNHPTFLNVLLSIDLNLSCSKLFCWFMKLIYVTLRQSSDWLVCLTCHYVLCCDFFFFFTSHLQLYQWARWAVVRQSISLVASQSRSSLGCFDWSLSGYISQGSQSTQFWCAVWLPSVCVAIISNQIAAVSLNTHTWHRISVSSLTCFPCSHVCSL